MCKLLFILFMVGLAGCEHILHQRAFAVNYRPLSNKIMLRHSEDRVFPALLARVLICLFDWLFFLMEVMKVVTFELSLEE